MILGSRAGRVGPPAGRSAWLSSWQGRTSTGQPIRKRPCWPGRSGRAKIEIKFGFTVALPMRRRHGLDRPTTLAVPGFSASQKRMGQRSGNFGGLLICREHWVNSGYNANGSP